MNCDLVDPHFYTCTTLNGCLKFPRALLAAPLHPQTAHRLSFPPPASERAWGAHNKLPHIAFTVRD